MNTFEIIWSLVIISAFIWLARRAVSPPGNRKAILELRQKYIPVFEKLLDLKPPAATRLIDDLIEAAIEDERNNRDPQAQTAYSFDDLIEEGVTAEDYHRWASLPSLERCFYRRMDDLFQENLIRHCRDEGESPRQALAKARKYFAIYEGGLNRLVQLIDLIYSQAAADQPAALSPELGSKLTDQSENVSKEIPYQLKARVNHYIEQNILGLKNDDYQAEVEASFSFNHLVKAKIQQGQL